MTTPTAPTPTTISMPRMMLHMEGLAVFIISIVLYRQLSDASWWLFALLLLVPDFAMLPYFIDPKLGAVGYNLAHTYLLPVSLAVVAALMGWQTVLALALIWVAHIGMDRAAGYGLKYGAAFKETHLGRV